MKFKPHDIFKKYPDIEDIAIRLDESEKEAKEKNKGRGPSTDLTKNNESDGKRIFVYIPEHAVISHFYKDGRWEQTPYTLKPGREAFLKDLAKILETRNPDALKVEIYKGKTRKTDPAYAKDIYLSENPLDFNADGKEHAELGSLVKKFDESLNDVKKNPEASNFQIELLRKEFEMQLSKQQHQSELNELKHHHQSEINELQAIIVQKDEHIEELAEELEDYEGELNGLQVASSSAKEKPFGEILLSRVLVQAGENLLRNNPKILKIGLGLSDDEVKTLFDKEIEKIDGVKPTDNSSFTETQVKDDLNGLDEKHVQGIKDLNEFFKQINVLEFKKIYTIDCLLQDLKTGLLNTELADKVLQFINQTNQTNQTN